MLKPIKLAFLFISSYGFAVVLLLFLLLLTFLGTLEQAELGLYAVQQKYFESIFLVHHFFGVVPVPLPGAYLCMILFAANLICGGILRAPKDWRTPGVLITHIGILVMLAGAFVTFKYSLDGNMRLYEGEESDEFVSYNDWVIEIGRPEAGAEMLVIQQDKFIDLKPHEERTFRAPSLPFTLTLSGFGRNTEPAPAGQSGARAVDGITLRQLPLDPKGEQNAAGTYVSVTDKASGETTEGIVWGYARQPFIVESGGEDWAIHLTHKTWQVPFSLRLDKFHHELHPGTNMPANFESEVTKFEDGSEEQIRIWMNHPLRNQGYTFFQSSWGPSNAGPNDPLYSVFSVVKNPADASPLWSCIIISIGMSIHFLQKLLRYLKLESRRRAA